MQDALPCTANYLSTGGGIGATGSIHSATGISTNGNIQANGNILAGNFVKTGGTASQFLKADGSVDNNVYLTAGGATAASTLQEVTDNGNTTTNNAVFGLSKIGTWSEQNTYAQFGNKNVASGTSSNYGLIQKNDGSVYIDGPVIGLNSSNASAPVLINSYTNNGSGSNLQVNGSISVSNGTALLKLGSVPILARGGSTDDAIRIHAPSATGQVVINPKSSNAQSEQTVFLANGNVGIGTNNPLEKLAVNGVIHAKEVKVDAIGWPDFVFEKTYKLTSLAALSQYIKINNHLPDMPSAAEAEKNGIELGEMNKKLLQKVE